MIIYQCLSICMTVPLILEAKIGDDRYRFEVQKICQKKFASNILNNI